MEYSVLHRFFNGIIMAHELPVAPVLDPLTYLGNRLLLGMHLCCTLSSVRSRLFSVTMGSSREFESALNNFF